MTQILIINPNSTESMTEKVRVAATMAAPADASIVARTSHQGPASIQGPEDGELALPGLLQEIQKGIDEGFDAFILACFDDTGLDQARTMTDKPVLGIGEAAFHTSMLRGHRFSVVTTLSVSVPVIEENLQRYGIAEYCRKVRASEVPVLALEEPGSDAEKRISSEIGLAVQQDDCQSIVLGCAGMTDLADRLSAEHKLPVVDGVVSATRMAYALAF